MIRVAMGSRLLWCSEACEKEEGLSELLYSNVGVVAEEDRGRVLVIDARFLQLQSGARVGRVRGEEGSGVGNVAFGPLDLMKFREVLNQVAIRTPALIDLTDVDDGGSGGTTPMFSHYGMGQILRSEQEMIMRPSHRSKLGHSEVLNISESMAECRNKVRHFSPRSIKRGSGVFPELGVDSEGEKTIGLGEASLDGELSGLPLGTVAA
jgi:hypothetical protein